MTTPKNNSATRLLSVVNSALGKDGKTRTQDVWASVFGLPAGAPSNARAVSQQLLLLYEELDRVKDGMAKLDIESKTYAGALEHIGEAISPGALYGPWENHRAHLQAEVRTALNFCGQLLGNEEDTITAEDLTSILADVEDLESSLKSSQLPEPLKELIRTQLERIRVALKNYRVVGARALRDAAKAAVMDVVAAQDEIKAHTDAKEVQGLGKLIKRVGKAADAVVKSEKLITAATKIYGYIEHFFPGSGPSN